MLSEIKKAVLLFIIGAYAAPNPAQDILSFCCDAKRIAARGHKHTLCVCVPVKRRQASKERISAKKETRYITALLCSARPNGCR